MRLTYRPDRRAFLGGAITTAVTGASVRPLMAQGLSVPPPRKPPPRAGDLIAGADLDAEVDYAVFDSFGALLEARDADRPVAPASTLKVLTAQFALDRLGGDARFRTRVLRAGDDLILAGGGDPTLDSDGLAVLAEQTVAAWTNGAPQRFFVYGGALPAIAEISPEQDDYLAYNPTISGMMLNFNRVHMSWQAGGAGMSLQARAGRNSPVAYTIRAVASGQGSMFSWREEDGKEIWTVNRNSLGRAGSRWLPVRRPELYAGDVFQTLCRARGLVLPMPQLLPDLPSDMIELAVHESDALADVLFDMMKYSTNLTAEVVGLHASGAPDLITSARAMQTWAQVAGLGTMDLRDHSGISPETRVTARAMARVVHALAERFDMRSMLKHIGLQDARGRAADGDLRLDAKTGTLNFVSNLVGYGSLPGHGEVVFATFISDMARRAATEGQELPAGVITWTHRAKHLQQQLVDAWVRRYV